MSGDETHDDGGRIEVDYLGIISNARHEMSTRLHRGDCEALEGVDEPVMLIGHDEYSEAVRQLDGQEASSSTLMSNELPLLLEAARAANAAVIVRLGGQDSPE